MKKNLIILALALLIALPVFGLAADAMTPEVQVTETTPAAPLGGQYGRRWNQTAPEATIPQAGFVDADNDGLCDNCGNAQGKNTNSPNYVDENTDGVCDHFGTDQQNQGQRRMQGVQGRGQGMKDRGQNAQGNGQSFVDADGNGVCDNLGAEAGQVFGRGRNRK